MPYVRYGAAVAAQGWCPSTHRIHPAPDGGLARVRVPGGTLRTDQLRAVASAARSLGSGTVDVTSRANLQIRGVAPTAAAALRERLAPVGLSWDDPELEDRLNVLASPTAGFADDEVIDVGPLVDATVAALRGVAAAPLPHKVGFVLDGGGTPSLRATTLDLCLGAIGGDRLDVALGTSLDAVAPHQRVSIGPHALGDLVQAVVRRCGVGVDGRPARVAEIAAEIGHAALVADLATSVELAPGDGSAPHRSTDGPGLGLHRSARTDSWWLWIAPADGAVTADHLDELADLAADTGAGRVRLTPWRSVVLPGVADPEHARAALAATRWTTDAPVEPGTRHPMAASR